MDQYRAPRNRNPSLHFVGVNARPIDRSEPFTDAAPLIFDSIAQCFVRVTHVDNGQTCGLRLMERDVDRDRCFLFDVPFQWGEAMADVRWWLRTAASSHLDEEHPDPRRRERCCSGRRSAPRSREVDRECAQLRRERLPQGSELRGSTANVRLLLAPHLQPQPDIRSARLPRPRTKHRACVCELMKPKRSR